MGNKWHEIKQNPEYLDARNEYFFNKKNIMDLCETLKINKESKLKILDVGCGTGAFLNRLKYLFPHLVLFGIDNDEVMIDYACNKYHNIDFLVQNALEMNFLDNSFDIVINITYLINEPNYDEAIEEMKRVLNKDGLLVSIAPSALKPSFYEYGNYNKEIFDSEKMLRIENLIYGNLLNSQIYKNVLNLGLHVSKTPIAFAQHQFQNINVMSMGFVFSLSDTTINEKTKIDYIMSVSDNKINIVQKYIEYNQQSGNILSTVFMDNISEYIKMQKKWREFWLNNLNDNSIWEWYAESNIVVVANK